MHQNKMRTSESDSLLCDYVQERSPESSTMSWKYHLQVKTKGARELNPRHQMSEFAMLKFMA